MYIKQLQQVVSIIEQGTLSAAARQLNISQPALTRSIRTLEQEIGVDLFDRNTRKFKPNIKGLHFLRRAQAILAEWKRCQEEILQLDHNVSGIVSVNGSPLTAARLIPEAIAKFYTLMPNARVIVGNFNMSLEEQLQGLRDGKTDLLVSIIDRPSQEDGLRREILFEPSLKIVCRKNHPATELANASLRELLQFPWISPPAGSKPRLLIDSEFKRIGCLPPIAPLEMSARNMIIPTLCNSDHLAILPYHPVCAETEWLQLTALDIPLSQKSWPIGIIMRYATDPTPSLDTFQRLLADIVRGRNLTERLD